MQAVWNDSMNGALKFSYAEETLLPPMPGSFKRQLASARRNAAV